MSLCTGEELRWLLKVLHHLTSGKILLYKSVDVNFFSTNKEMYWHNDWHLWAYNGVYLKDYEAIVQILRYDAWVNITNYDLKV